jgi:large subunit ribosomal protein L4
MPTVKVYNTTGKEVETLALNESVFGAEYNEPLIHQVVVAQLNNARQGTKSTLTRSEVRGGGKKPWRQKGTGSARQGSIRSPQWIKGGVVFAPKERDFSQKINKEAKRVALKSALSEKVRASEFIVLDDLKIAAPKTKEMVKILNNLKLDKHVLLVLAEKSDDVLRASNNISNVVTTFADLINVYDIVRSDKCLITKAAVKKIEEVYAE